MDSSVKGQTHVPGFSKHGN